MKKSGLIIILASFPQKSVFPFYFSTDRESILGELL
jgi:hypothetical protein